MNKTKQKTKTRRNNKNLPKKEQNETYGRNNSKT